MSLGNVKIMGVLNVTPDSFSDGGKFQCVDDARHQIESMLANDVDYIDVGGESTRPGAAAVSAQQELDRVIPVVELIRSMSDVAISVDTSTPEVMLQAAKSGANMINDVRALTRPGALDAAVQTGLDVCLMHMQGQPADMQDSPQYSDVVKEVSDYLVGRAGKCINAGIQKEKIWLDPGFGFGKTLEHNLQLLKELRRFHESGFPLLVGMSRKSMIGAITGRAVNDRLAGSLAVAMLAIQNGAQIIRVHDVAETRDVVRVLQAVQ